MKKIIDNLYITKGQIFAEFVLEALIKKGVPRFIAYRDVQRVAFGEMKKIIDIFITPPQPLPLREGASCLFWARFPSASRTRSPLFFKIRKR